MNDEVETLICEHCAKPFARRGTRGPVPRYCSPSHKQWAYIKRALAELGEYRRRYGPLDGWP